MKKKLLLFLLPLLPNFRRGSIVLISQFFLKLVGLLRLSCIIRTSAGLCIQRRAICRGVKHAEALGDLDTEELMFQ